MPETKRMRYVFWSFTQQLTCVCHMTNDLMLEVSQPSEKSAVIAQWEYVLVCRKELFLGGGGGGFSHPLCLDMILPVVPTGVAMAADAEHNGERRPHPPCMMGLEHQTDVCSFFSGGLVDREKNAPSLVWQSGTENIDCRRSKSVHQDYKPLSNTFWCHMIVRFSLAGLHIL